MILEQEGIPSVDQDTTTEAVFIEGYQSGETKKIKQSKTEQTKRRSFDRLSVMPEQADIDKVRSMLTSY